MWLDRPKAPRSVRCLDGLASVALVAANGDPPLVAAPWLSQAQAQLEACQPTGQLNTPPRFFYGKSRLVPPILGGDSTTRVLNTAQITEISAVFPEKHQFLFFQSYSDHSDHSDLCRVQQNTTVTHSQIRLFENGDRIDLQRTASRDPLAVAYPGRLETPKNCVEMETICRVPSRTCSFRFLTATILSVLISTAHASGRVPRGFAMKSLRECSTRLQNTPKFILVFRDHPKPGKWQKR